MLFGLLLIPLVAMIGLAVDFGHVYSVTSHTQAALDAAALAAGRAAQLNSTNCRHPGVGGRDSLLRSGQAHRMWSAATLQFSPNSQQYGVHGHGDLVGEDAVPERPQLRSPIRMPRSGAPAGCQSNGFGCVMVTSTATAALCPSVACTGSIGGGSNVEISLMLDVTGSMCQPLHQDRCGQVCCQGSDRHRRVARPEPILLQGGAGAVRRGGQRGHDARPARARHGDGEDLRRARRFTTRASMTNTSIQPTKQWITVPKASGSGTNTWHESRPSA